MTRTPHSLLGRRPLLLASLIALLMSCGPQQRGSSHATAHVRSAAPPALILPTLRPQMTATMSLIDGRIAEEIRAKLSYIAPAPEAVAVTFRLGPRMQSRTFEIGLDGSVDDADMQSLRGLFRCRRSGRTHRIDTGLLSKIADLSRHYEGHTIQVVSAYRHGRYAARTSRHRHGRAIDIKVVGIPAAQVRDYLWARYEQEVGVGFYKQQQFIHLDHRTDYPATAWTQKRYNALNNYKPGWARQSRRSKLVVALAEIKIRARSWAPSF